MAALLLTSIIMGRMGVVRHVHRDLDTTLRRGGGLSAAGFDSQYTVEAEAVWLKVQGCSLQCISHPIPPHLGA